MRPSSLSIATYPKSTKVDESYPKLSESENYFGPFNLNKTSLAPPEIKVLSIDIVNKNFLCLYPKN